ncbi:farnesyl-diphosphate farnesyltransferase [Oikeobacillus pervagus]|uniref:Farnesyl-diphosphate farnesyltransferase n=1 Tax=Oikeobacillus pervagus TaxID=1325931 RepID=A0AAJ1T066_9BACI|nr:phytoene/squalene synthase family protein [Oikeobacillus pervagus]MDQ0216079.1 farnesyl-diphosphate farnesyltransferase [Oikeobacillus pervagus]
MSEQIDLNNDATRMLLQTSRTFFIPINKLAPRLKEAVGSAYLCMRAIDEIEDHPELSANVKADLLYKVRDLLQEPIDREKLNQLFSPYSEHLPEVTLRLADWANYSPETIEPEIRKATAIMAGGMADWVLKDWVIRTEEELDDYTYYVAGLVGVMLSDIWKWYCDLETDKEQAIAFGRGLQAVNIIRNRKEDLERGVDFWPNGWGIDDMFAYAKRNLGIADQYTKSIEGFGTIHTFCQIPLTLAYGTLKALEQGHEKLSRSDVKELVSQVTEESK